MMSAYAPTLASAAQPAEYISEVYLGDLLLEPIKEEMEEADYTAAEKKPSEQPADTSEPESSAAETVSETDTSSEAETSSEETAAAESEDTSSEQEATAAGSVVGTGVMVGSCAGSAARQIAQNGYSTHSGEYPFCVESCS